MQPFSPEQLRLGAHLPREVTTQDLKDALYATGEYFNDPGAAADETVFTCPPGYYAIITHYAATWVSVAATTQFLLLYIGHDGLTYTNVHAEMSPAAANIGDQIALGNLPFPIILNEGEILRRLCDVAPQAQSGGRVVYVPKTPAVKP